MTEPCPRCPAFVVRCGHLGERWVRIDKGLIGRYFAVSLDVNEGFQRSGPACTRAEADAEFDRREEALLA